MCTAISQTVVCLLQFAQRRQRSQLQPQQEPPLTGPPPSGRVHHDKGADEAMAPQEREASSGEAASERAQIDAENRARLAQMDPAEVSHVSDLTTLAPRFHEIVFPAPGHVQR